MEPFKQFDLNKQATMQRLQQLGDALRQLGDLGLDVRDDLVKLESAVNAVESDVLRIALMGAFSDGKTSVIAAWLGQVMDDMKIDMDESSDRIAIYRPEGLPGKCEIVDTPGLFGDKQLDTDGHSLMYQDVTKRYISEAHLILYVVDATNPLKDSHFDSVRWVLRDLGKLAATVFVINKMDEVTDLTDAGLYDKQAQIKRTNLEGKLARAAALSPEEVAQLRIVCMAANPNGRGLSFWFAKPEHYAARSRLEDLQHVTRDVLDNTVPDVLRAKTGLDVVHDLVRRKLLVAAEQVTDLESRDAQTREELQRIEQDIHKGRSEVKRLAGQLFSDLKALEAQLHSTLRPLSLEDLRGFMEDEIGYTEQGAGFKLHLQIKTLVDRYCEESTAVSGRIARDITLQLEAGKSFASTWGDKAVGGTINVLKGLSRLPPGAIRESIFVARNALTQVTGYAVKFKPWGAAKLAGNISQWAGPVGAGIQIGVDLYQVYKATELEKELAATKASIAELIKEPFNDLYALLSDPQKVRALLSPELDDYDRVVEHLQDQQKQLASTQQRLLSIREQFERLGAPQGGT